MTSAELLTDAFGRIRESVAEVLAGLSLPQLQARLDGAANPVSWLVWHLTRVQDDHVASAFGAEQVWSADNWAKKFGLPAEALDVGYGHSSTQVADVSGAICGTSS